MSAPQTGRTLVVLDHPDVASSRINAALAAAVQDLPDVVVHDLHARYPDFRIDVAAEQAAITAAEEIVLQFPTHWYSVPALLKLWLDDVLVRGWAYGAAAPGALVGKRLRIVTSTGGRADAYAHGAFHGWPFDEVLVPLKATAKRLGMRWTEPLVLHGAREVTDAELATAAERYRALLTEPEPATDPVAA